MLPSSSHWLRPHPHPDGFGQRGFHCPEGLEQDQKGQPDTGLGRGVSGGSRRWRRKGGCFQKEETGSGGRGSAHIDRIRPGGRIIVKQYVSVGLSCH